MYALVPDVIRTIAAHDQEVWINLALVDQAFGQYAWSEAGRRQFITLFTMVDHRDEWRLLGRLHRGGDLPVYVIRGGIYQEWCQFGVRHRDNGPAFIEYGSQYWYQHGLLHREGDLPAIIMRADLTRRIVPLGQATHIFAAGDREWYRLGVRHRADGQPAIIRGNGACEWWVDGVWLGATPPTV